MEITMQWLEENGACQESRDAWRAERDNNHEVMVHRLMDGGQFDWANWLVSRLLARDDRVRYAIHAAELVLSIYETTYPDDDRPRKAIEAAKEYLSAITVRAAYAAAYAAARAAEKEWQRKRLMYYINKAKKCAK